MIIYDADDPLVLNGTYDREGYKPGERARIEQARRRAGSSPSPVKESRPMAKKPKGPKTVSYQLINPKTDHGAPMYERLYALIDAHHKDLQDARFALAWNTSWKPDVDGRVTLGKCKKASDLDRELAPYDFIILLRKEFWTHPLVTVEQQQALLDHELMHAAVKYGEDGNEPVVDERGRTVYRTRKHDIEEFADIVNRHGLYKRDLEQFGHAILRVHKEGIVPDPTPAATVARRKRKPAPEQPATETPRNLATH